jgi:hypothetical protein
MFQTKNISVAATKRFIFKKYPLTIFMFLAGMCSLLIALSISQAGHPDASGPQGTIVKTVPAKAAGE